METLGNYLFFWLLYLAAASAFTAILWRFTRFEHAIWTSYSVRAVSVAIIFTPWYSNPQDSGMAPALMVATLDAITVGGSAAYRSFVPLVLAVLFALLVAGVLSALRKRKLKKGRINNKLSSVSETSR